LRCRCRSRRLDVVSARGGPPQQRARRYRLSADHAGRCETRPCLSAGRHASCHRGHGQPHRPGQVRALCGRRDRGGYSAGQPMGPRRHQVDRASPKRAGESRPRASRAPARPGSWLRMARSPRARRRMPGSSRAGNEVVTRQADRAILKGITRTVLLDVLKSHDLTLIERPFTVDRGDRGPGGLHHVGQPDRDAGCPDRWAAGGKRRTRTDRHRFARGFPPLSPKNRDDLSVCLGTAYAGHVGLARGSAVPSNIVAPSPRG
jgi:hypothetical protein